MDYPVKNVVKYLQGTDLGNELEVVFGDGRMFLNKLLLLLRSDLIRPCEVDLDVYLLLPDYVLEIGYKLRDLLYFGQTVTNGSQLEELNSLMGILSIKIDIIVSQSQRADDQITCSIEENISDYQATLNAIIEDSLIAKKLVVQDGDHLEICQTEDLKICDTELEALNDKMEVNMDEEATAELDTRDNTDLHILKDPIEYANSSLYGRDGCDDPVYTEIKNNCDTLCDVGGQLLIIQEVSQEDVVLSMETLGQPVNTSELETSSAQQTLNTSDQKSSEKVDKFEVPKNPPKDSKRKSGKAESFVCDINNCNMYFKSLQKFGAHTLEVHKCAPLKCPEHINGCAFRAPTKQKIQFHLSGVHREKYSEDVSCDICSKVLPSKVHLKEHVKRIHSEGEEKVCPMCGIRKKHLADHIIRAHKSKQFSCDYCPKMFKTRSQLRHHHNVHTGFKPYTCADCPSRFSRLHHRKTHLDQTNHKPGPVLKEPADGRLHTSKSTILSSKYAKPEEKPLEVIEDVEIYLETADQLEVVTSDGQTDLQEDFTDAKERLQELGVDCGEIIRLAFNEMK